MGNELKYFLNYKIQLNQFVNLGIYVGSLNIEIYLLTIYKNATFILIKTNLK